MKKLSLILASALLIGGISFGAPVVKHLKQDTKPPVEKQKAKPLGKPVVKPAAKPAGKPAAKPGAVKKTPVKKAGATKKAAK